MIHRTLFDTFERKNIADTVMSLAKTIGVSSTCISHFFSKNPRERKNFSINNRYIKPESVQLCFTYVNVKTGYEYLCPTNKSLFIQTNSPYIETEGKYLNKLKNGLQLTCKINGNTFLCKEFASLLDGVAIRKNSTELRHKIRPTTLARQIKNRLISTISRKLQNMGGKKKNKTCHILGCDILFFIGWLENQFVDGMTWENKSEWDIDHIIPTNLFDIIREDEQKRAFHYSNCRPLWTEENIKRPKDGSDTLNSPLEQRVINYWRELGMSTERPSN